ncbi:MAG: hypothetical protein R3E77_01225 [Steroidobacteraceae bacterium]
MIATPKFVFLHLHKSGGTFVNEALLHFIPEAVQLGYHLPRAMIPDYVAHLPVLALVRNPYSYYVSWYFYQSGREHKNALFQVLSDDGRLGFRDTIRNMLDLGSGSLRLDLLLARLPHGYDNRGLNLPAAALAPIRNSGLGFYSYLYRYMYQSPQPTPLHVGRMESLRSDLLAMLEHVAQPVSASMRSYIEAEAPRNTSDHRHHASYYDAELAELVAERDALVIDQHGYGFEICASEPAQTLPERLQAR